MTDSSFCTREKLRFCRTGLCQHPAVTAGDSITSWGATEHLNHPHLLINHWLRYRRSAKSEEYRWLHLWNIWAFLLGNAWAAQILWRQSMVICRLDVQLWFFSFDGCHDLSFGQSYTHTHSFTHSQGGINQNRILPVCLDERWQRKDLAALIKVVIMHALWLKGQSPRLLITKTNNRVSITQI